MHGVDPGNEAAGSAPAIIGHITHISGSHAKILLLFDLETESNRKGDVKSPYIGTLLTVDTESAMVLGLITSMSVPGTALDVGNSGIRIAEVDLVGELQREPDGYLRTFRRGVSVYPRLGDTVKVASHAILQKAYYLDQTDAVAIG